MRRLCNLLKITQLGQGGARIQGQECLSSVLLLDTYSLLHGQDFKKHILLTGILLHDFFSTSAETD